MMIFMKEKRSKGRFHIWIWGSLTVVFLLVLIVAIGVGIYLRTNFETRLPSDFFKLTVKGESPQFYIYHFEDRVNRVGELEEVTANLFAQKQTSYIAYPDIPRHLIDAFVAIEDKRFYTHNGVDWSRTLAASVNYVLGFSKHFGGSTITQQLVKNMTGHDEVTLKRKIQEIFYALDMERTLDKSEILELYLNVIHFSDNCDGISQAAAHYFSKTPQELTVAECATIAAITNSPSYYNPIRNPQNNLERRNLILSEMYGQGYLSEAEYREAIAEELVLNPQENGNTGEGINSWYVDMVIEDVINDLMAKYGLNRNAASQFFYAGGLKIEMAMDEEIQEMAEEYYRTAVKVPRNADGVSAQSALIVIDSRTGDVLGVAGAIGDKTGNRVQNFATQTQRPPGSALKPISVYAPALEKGIINWASVYDDVPVEFGTSGKVAWPRNATGVYRGLTTVSYAVAHSTNTVAVRILEQLGLENSYHFAKERFHLAGMVSEVGANDCDRAALALGQLNYGVTLRDLTAAYTVFADAGVYHPWRSYYRVLDSDGNILLSRADSGEIVLSAGNAAIMTKLLQGVIKDGTSSSVTLGKLTECAGKTGTTNNDNDRWFVGYTPDIICGVWCGYEYPEALEGRNLCTQIWNQVMQSIVKEKGGRTTFTVPSSVVRATYCKDSGKLLTDACQSDPRGSRAEVGWFLQGHEPSAHCDRHVLCDYDAEYGGVCHGNCPVDSLKKVALIRVERHFPMQIYVSDAQYVYAGDPYEIAPNENTSQAYFAKEKHGFWGISAASKQYNRSCTAHLHPPEPYTAWDYLIPRFLPFFDE